MKRDRLAPRAWGATLAVSALALCAALTIPTAARADIDVRLDLGRAPRGNFIAFRSQPHRIYDRTSGVYVIDDAAVGDYDAFQYGNYYWVFRDGYWYRSSNWNGGFEVVSPQYVPVQLYSVPAYRWHNHPSYASWHDRGWYRGSTMRDRNAYYDRDRGYYNRDRYYDNRDRNTNYYRTHRTYRGTNDRYRSRRMRDDRRYRDNNDNTDNNRDDRSY